MVRRKFQTKKGSTKYSGSNSDIVKQFETSHFIFYTKEQDSQCVKDLSNALEDNYTRVTTDLHKSLDKKVEIYIYSDLNTYHKVINRPDAPNWLVANTGGYENNKILMVNPLQADGRPYSDFMKIIVHEFTHVVTNNLNPNGIPIWLNEGVSMYEAKQCGESDRIILKTKLSDKIPTLQELQTDSVTFGNINGYQCSFFIVDYIVKNYGYDKLITLIQSPSEIQNILGISIEDFQEKWVASLY